MSAPLPSPELHASAIVIRTQLILDNFQAALELFTHELQLAEDDPIPDPIDSGALGGS